MPPPPADRPPPRILVADDVASARMLYTTVLSQLGYEILQAADGEQALQAIRRERPDLAILDVGMPRRTGLEVLEALKAADDRTPIIVITAHKEKELVLEAARQGICSFLTKPIDLAEFRRRVTESLAPPEKPGDDGVEADPFENPGPVPLPATEPLPFRRGQMTAAPFVAYLLEGRDAWKRKELMADLTRRPPTELRSIAEKRMKSLRGKQIPSMLHAAFRAGDATVRLLCVQLLPKEIDEGMQTTLLDAWGVDDDFHVRRAVAERLAGLGGEAGIRALLPLLSDPAKDVAERARRSILVFPPERIVRGILAYCATAGIDPPHIVHEVLDGLRPDHRARLMTGLIRDGDVPLRILIAGFLADERIQQGAFPLLQRLLKDPAKAVRRAAVNTMAARRDPAGFHALLPMLADPDPGLRRHARKRLETFRMRAQTKALIETLGQKTDETWARAPEVLQAVEGHTEGLSGVLAGLARNRGPSGRRVVEFVEAWRGRPLPAEIRRTLLNPAADRKEAVAAIVREMTGGPSLG